MEDELSAATSGDFSTMWVTKSSSISSLLPDHTMFESDISIMVMRHVSDITGYDRRTSELSNEPFDMK